MSARCRFIAGARCPECGELDRIQRCQDGERVWMECVACGMKRFADQTAEHPAADDSFFRGPPH